MNILYFLDRRQMSQLVIVWVIKSFYRKFSLKKQYFFYFQSKEEKKEEPKAASATTSDSDSDLEEMRKKYLKPVETPEKKKMLAKVKKISMKIGEGKK